MAYNAVDQQDHNHDLDEEYDSEHGLAPPPQMASLGVKNSHTTNSDGNGNGLGINYILDSIASRNLTTKGKGRYNELEDDFAEDDVQASPILSAQSSYFAPLHIPRPRRPRSPVSTAGSTLSPHSIPSNPILRTASGRSLALRHPTPDLQTLQGAYAGNIQHLEKTAERLSMTSSIEDAIKELHDEQKRYDSRRSSLLSSPGIPVVSRQISNASSIVEVNSTARSGGFSPAGYMMSPTNSFVTGNGRGRSASKGSRFGSRLEPELEGRPLDSFANMHSSISPTSPTLSRSASIAEMNEETTTLTKPIVDLLESPDLELNFPSNEEQGRPTTSASTNTYEQEKMFADFDGIHAVPQQRTVSGNMSSTSNISERPNLLERRQSSGTSLPMARPQSYADPSTGQQMVYYPAPVPMMLNLPQKLSKNPSSMARNKRRSQVLSSIPPAARQSAIWLPDVLEMDDDLEVPENDPIQQQEYIPQHQRASMGGRRLPEDMSQMPPQLRANAYFELPAANQTVELKEQSAVATLDSILDASAHAPVSAFTDHAFAGHLGAEVYGRAPMHKSRTSSTLVLDTPSKKRTSTFNILLRGRRASSTDLLDSEEEKRRATMSGVVESKIRSPIEDDDGEAEQDATLMQRSEDVESDDGHRDDEIYHGAPTTLLAELQLRKQQAKQRTRPLLQSFPNGMHSTLLEMDAVAQVQQKSRKQKRINLAWEDPAVLQQAEDEIGDDEDVPLAMLYAKQEDPLRPMGLMERRDMEDNEPLSRRRDRLQGKPPVHRASTMMHISPPLPAEEEGETLAERVRRLKGEGAESSLPAARPVSGDFTSELMSQFGGDLLNVKGPKGKGKEFSTSPGPEEEETLGQRRKRLQAEREARAKEVGGAPDDSAPQPEINKRRSMADILQAHPAAGASRMVSYEKPVGGLLGLHEKHASRRSSTMLDLNSPGHGNGRRISSSENIPPQLPQQYPQPVNMYNGNAMFPQPSLGLAANGNMWGNPMFANPYSVAYPGMQMAFPGMNAMNAMNMNMAMGMGMGMQPLNQGQIDMVERWRQSVMQ